ncbi:hypothetical protein GCM10027034_20140 [Ramlibacter solisilvae]|uniref:Uncharacterized protein n=1 Tax=Ramlibacter tataouinensis TaxID=94132 RepID=A0A127JVK3_9BURK|nr:hypothetical protein [Ramlibacter tataouinensis]AMO23909.1 hypothetical protein UC35_14865 [Ramlibacter tataouinensis]
MIQPFIKPPTRFVFLWWRDTTGGFILAEQYYWLLTRFESAKDEAGTWGEFLDLVGAEIAAYVESFLENDEVKLVRSDSMGEALEHAYIFSTPEFPATQCAEESYTCFGSRLPLELKSSEIRTEYGIKVGVFPKARFLELQEAMSNAGCELRAELCDDDRVILNYGR